MPRLSVLYYNIKFCKFTTSMSRYVTKAAKAKADFETETFKFKVNKKKKIWEKYLTTGHFMTESCFI